MLDYLQQSQNVIAILLKELFWSLEAVSRIVGEVNMLRHTFPFSVELPGITHEVKTKMVC